MKVPPLPRQTGGPFFETYTRGLTKADIERLFTRDTLEAYKFFSRNINFDELKKQPWHLRMLGRARLLFLAFTLKLTPARRLIYAIALLSSLIGLMELFREVHFLLIPHPAFAPGTMWLLTGFLLVNLLVLLEGADRLSLKNDLEIAREIQHAMLPRGEVPALGAGRVLLALGDVAGKGSPAALLMALLLAMMRTLVDEGLEDAALVTRLNVQIGRHSLPHSRFVTLFLSVLNPVTGELSYVNAGQNPPLLRRGNGVYERLRAGGMALGMFENASYTTGAPLPEPGDVLVMYSDGITEAEDTFDQPFDEAGVQTVVDGQCWGSAKELGWALFEAVETHS